jgi:hypothetical protein
VEKANLLAKNHGITVSKLLELLLLEEARSLGISVE